MRFTNDTSRRCTLPCSNASIRSKYFHWVDVQSLGPESPREEEDAAVVPYALRVLEECSEKGVRPWEKPGWHNLINRQGVAALNKIGYSVVSTFKQFRVSSQSAILRANTDKGRVYLKAGNKREGKVTEVLASIEPRLVHKPLYVDRENEWMLMEDYGKTLANRMSVSDFEALKDLISGIQVKASKHVQMLVEGGAPKVDVEDILRRTENMLKDMMVANGGGDDGETGDVAGQTFENDGV